MYVDDVRFAETLEWAKEIDQKLRDDEPSRMGITNLGGI